ncbi:hypothetical protein [Ramlibacter alkalitolerans]|uniref:Uncharacterized protein n=1 Tax=Ramlibacter alkalitolerans TaxID=2039631 RepID=A0ABS1JK84_9BURK|nr:hypothetical protein [Ramlibacter alkalitolerans]MBL0424336.1 hypothetical protein [Ramlibacter alkalitolerans]
MASTLQAGEAAAPPRKRYRRRPDTPVVAVRLDLETEGFSYRKWGAVQHCKAGDWIVNNDGDTYTVDAASFAATYRQLGPGTYVKTTPVWAHQADSAGVVGTKEGATHHAQGDYIVSNHEDGSDAYAMGADKFERLYEADE